MAILLGIYDKLIHAVSHFGKDIRGNFLFLLKFFLGAAAGAGSLALGIQWLLSAFPFHISFLFLGAVCGGIPTLLAQVRGQVSRSASLAWGFVGFLLISAIALIPRGNIGSLPEASFLGALAIFSTGLIIALALVLPGISTSHTLLVFGLYDRLLGAVTSWDLGYLGLLGLSVLLGIFLLTRPIEWALEQHTARTYSLITGFVLGSTLEIFRDKILPAIPEVAGLLWWLLSAGIAGAAFLLGYWGISRLSHLSEE